MQGCGSCSLCCKLLDVPGLAKVGQWCPNCKPGTPGGGCMIHNDRPEICLGYNCAWKLDDKAHETLRPDLCHVIFENLSENVVLGTLDPDYNISELIEFQIMSYLQLDNSVVLQTFEEKPRMYLAKGHSDKEVWTVIQNKLREYYE